MWNRRRGSNVWRVVMLRRAMWLTVLALPLAVAGCGGGTPAPTPRPAEGSETAVVPSPATATPTETPWNPVYGYDPGTSTAVAVVDGVVTQMLAGDIEALAALVLPIESPCITGLGAPTAFRCPAGVPAGSPVAVVFAQFCAGAVAFPASEIRATLRPLLDGSPRLWGLMEFPPGFPSSKSANAAASRYLLFVVNNVDPPTAFTLALGDDGRIHSVSYGCNEPPERVFRSWTTTATVLLSPPASPRPR